MNTLSTWATFVNLLHSPYLITTLDLHSIIGCKAFHFYSNVQVNGELDCTILTVKSISGPDR